MKRLIVALSALVLLAAVAVLATQILYDPGSARASTGPANMAEQLARGAYLVKAGNCMGCHTAQGRAIQTPYGSIHTANISPDRATGIGTWSADDFWRAIHNGKSKDGSFLYPAFPYPDYTKVTRADADAMYAWLMSQPAMHQPKRANTLSFPYNQRILLAFWRARYFQPGEYAAAPERSAQWNRGAYLVQGLGHCATCHTSRNVLADWYAVPLGGHGDSGELARLLGTGVSARKAVYGPMAAVVSSSLQHLSAEDTLAMATYLSTLPAPPQPAGHEAPAALLQRGERIYTRHCAECHQADGQGIENKYPSLRAGTSPLNAIRLVVNGAYPPSTGGNPRPYGMPPFGHTLADDDIAAVVTYVGASWGNRAAPVAPGSVARLRGVPVD